MLPRLKINYRCATPAYILLEVFFNDVSFICPAGEKAEKEKDADEDDVEINTDAR